MVTAPRAQDFKTNFPKSFDKLQTSNWGEIAHRETATRWMPMNSFDTGSSISRQSRIASLTRFINTSRDLAWVWHPRSSGTEATKYPSSSLSITTLNSLVTFKHPRHNFIVAIISWRTNHFIFIWRTGCSGTRGFLRVHCSSKAIKHFLYQNQLLHVFY